MTTLEITTEATPSTTVPAFVVAPINHTAMAQLVANEDYDAVLALTHDGELAANAYHVAYQRYVRQHLSQGAGPLCNCDLCGAELGCE